MFSRISGMFSNNSPNGSRGGRGRAFLNRNNNSPAAVEVGNGRGSSRRSNLGFGPTQKKHCSRPPSTTDTTSEVRTCLVDNSLAMIDKIASLYAERLMSDITLVINGAEFPAHRLILCSSSDVFQVMLMSPNWTESHENRVVLQESPECTEFFEDFLKYLYTGRLKLDLTNVMHLLTLGDKYNVKDLIVLCLEYMQYHIPAAAHQNQLVNWFQHTSNCGHYHVADMCKNFIKWNFDLVAKTGDFPLLELDLMVSILRDDDIVVEDEYTLFQFLVFWVDCQRSKFSADDPELEEKMCNIVQQSIELIRFPMMSPRQLADLLLCPLTQKYKEFLMDKMALGMAFHSGNVHRIFEMSELHPNRSKLFTSRLYCTDTWSICLVVEKFSALNHYQSQTLVFSTPSSASERFSEKQIEWVVDFYPKGVCFNKGLLIIWQGTLECPEYVMQTVRLSVNCKSDEDTEVRVQIGILITGSQDGVEHIRNVSRKNYIFSGRDKVLNIDDVLSYDELTPCAICKSNATTSPHSNNRPSGCSHRASGSGQTGDASSCFSAADKSCFLVGEELDSLKIRIIITPMSELGF